ncbi:MAG: hypothetical protein J7539_12730 [Niabella sp.]|nr:hypothetical protein [Niabella sp.]
MANTTGKKFGGRAKGTSNKVTANLRDSVQAFLDANWPDVQSVFDKLDPKDKLAFIEKLMQYSLPKLQAVESKVDATVKDEVKQVMIINGQTIEF